jgi:hypothetical protein
VNLINLVFRFCLELNTLIVIGVWGWDTTNTWLRYVLAIGLPLLAATIWGVFNVPEDPSRSGRAPVVVPGVVRLMIEILFFATGAWAFYAIGLRSIGQVFIGLVIVHYVLSYNRLKWLIRQ